MNFIVFIGLLATHVQFMHELIVVNTTCNAPTNAAGFAGTALRGDSPLDNATKTDMDSLLDL